MLFLFENKYSMHYLLYKVDDWNIRKFYSFLSASLLYKTYYYYCTENDKATSMYS